MPPCQRLTGICGAIGIAAVAAAACDPRDFDAEGEKAPVKSIGAPSGYVGKDFGLVLLPLADGGGSPAAFVASGTNSLSITFVKIDARGGVSSNTAPDSQLQLVDESPVTGLAEIAAVGASPQRLLLGAPDLTHELWGQGFVYPVSGDTPAQPLAVPTEIGSGRAVGVGPVTAAGSADYVIASDPSVKILAGGSVGAVTEAGMGDPGCDPTFDGEALNTTPYASRRALVLESLWTGGLEGTVQVVVGSPHAGLTKMGTVSVFGVNTPGGAVGCLGMVPGTQPLFGVSLASGDFNGDHVPDLVVGAPPKNAAVFLGPFPAGFSTPLDIVDSEGSEFGYAVAALNVDGSDADGTPGDEALIADPDATVNGQAGAGHVVAYRYVAAMNKMVKIESKVYADNSPGTDARYGASVRALKFCTTPTGATTPVTSCAAGDPGAARVLLVGAQNQVFLYFTVGDKLPADRKDVRLR